MPTFLQKIIFDTSAINALEADKDLVAITQTLGVAYKSRHTGNNSFRGCRVS